MRNMEQKQNAYNCYNIVSIYSIYYIYVYIRDDFRVGASILRFALDFKKSNVCV